MENYKFNNSSLCLSFICREIRGRIVFLPDSFYYEKLVIIMVAIIDQ